MKNDECFKIDFSEEIDFMKYIDLAYESFDKIINKSGLGSNLLGWVTLPEVYDRLEYDKMKVLSKKVRKSEILVVIGVGGSFLGSKAVIKALQSYFNKSDLEIIFVGTDLSGE